MSYFQNITKQEEKDRWITTAIFNDILSDNGYTSTLTEAEITDYVDVYGKATSSTGEVDFNIEIKERNKSEEQLKKYPTAELKVDKYNRMKSVSNGKGLYFVVLLNQSRCLIFNMNTIDWSKVEKKDWTIKITQFDPNSGYHTIPTYFIPYSLAIRDFDCTKYYQDYANNQENRKKA